MELLKGKSFERVAQIEREHIDVEKRTVPIAISSENPVREWWGTNTLIHSKKAIDLSRNAEHGLALLWRHGDEMLGRVKDIKLSKDKVLRGVAYFGNSTLAQEKWQDIQDGVLTDVSVGGSFLQEPEQQEDGTYITRSWSVNEVSFVPLGADASVGIHRENNGGNSATTEGDGNMADENTNGGGDAATVTDTTTVTDFKLSQKQIFARGELAGEEKAIKRIDGIRDIFAAVIDRGVEYSDLMNWCIDNKEMSVERSKDELMKFMLGQSPGSLAQPFEQHNGSSLDTQTVRETSRGYNGGSGGRVQAGVDAADKKAQGMSDAILCRAGGKIEGENPYRGMRLNEMAKACLEDVGFITRGMTPEEYVPKAFRTSFTRAGQTTSDFPIILENTLHKMVLTGFQAHASTYQRFCKIGDVTDFRAWQRLVPGLIGNLDEVNERGEYKNKNFPDAEKNPNQVQRRGNILDVTPEVIINDDLGQIMDMANALGMAGSRAIERKVYLVLEANAALSDGVALFHASHGNLAASGAVPSVTTLEAGDVAMSAQTAPGDDAELLEIMPQVAVCKRVLRGTMLEIVNAEFNDDANANQRKPNRVRGIVSDIVGSGRLVSATAWYLFADPNQAPVIEVVFLNGQREPRIVQEENFRTSGMAWKVELPFGVAAIDYRGAWKNAGA